MKTTAFLTLTAPVVLVLGGAFAATAQEADFTQVQVPSTIEVVIASEAGGSTDTLGRIVMAHWQQVVSELTGTNVSTVIRNLPGAGTEIGATAIADARSDGSTIGILNLPHVPLIEASRNPSFAPWIEAYTPLGTNVVDPNVIILGANSPYETLAEALEATTANPGSVIVGAQGPLSDDQLALYALQDASGAEFTFIPFDGGAGSNRALLGGEIDITIGNVFDYLQLADSAKDAAVFSTQRYHMIPDVPTVQESLSVTTGQLAATRAFAAPAGLPDDIASLYIEAFKRTFEDPDFQQEAIERNMTLVDPVMGENLRSVMQEQQDLVVRLYPYFEDANAAQ